MAGPDLSTVDVNQTGSSGFASSLLMFPVFYIATIFRLVRFAFLNPHFLGQGLLFSASLLRMSS